MKTLSTTLYYSMLLVFLCFQSQMFAQGMLQGIVRDTTNKEGLVGANIFLKGTAIGGVTDIEGKYRIMNIPAGTYTVRTSYLGYKTKETEVTITDGATQTLNAQLLPVVIEGQEVLITAQARGQISAINQQVSSNTIVNVVSEEKIKELPDANAAEAIGRLPGISLMRNGGEATGVVLRGLSSKFSNITVDGVKIPPTDPNSRDVDLSTISQGALSGIELYKTLTPDQDADAIAGTINLVTRKAPSERLLQFDVKGNYNNLMNSAKQYDVQLQYGERFFEDIFGVQIHANSERKIRSREDIRSRYTYSKSGLLTSADPNGNNDWNRTAFVVDFTDEIRNRNGGKVIFDLNTIDSGSVKLTGSYSETDRNSMLHNRTYPSGGTSAWQYNYEYIEQKISTMNTSLQGQNYIENFKIEWNASYAQSKSSNPFDCRLSFTEPGGSGGFTSPTKLPADIATIPFADNNFTIATLDSTQFMSMNTSDAERTVFLNVSKKFTLGDIFINDIKIGGKYKAKSRWMTTGNHSWNNYKKYVLATANGPISVAGTRFDGVTNSAVSLMEFLDQPISSRNLLGAYSMNPLMNSDALKLWWDLNKDAINPAAAQDYGENGLSLLSNYNITERVSSAFIMNTLTVEELATIIFGLRLEQENNDYGGKYSDGSVGGTGIVQIISSRIIDTTAKYSEAIWLPSVQLALKPTEYLRFRFAVYRALARPDFNLRLPQFSYNQSTSALFIGNPNLKDAKAWNYEVNAQIYNSTVGLISISGFYKVIEDLFHQTRNVNISWANEAVLGAPPHTPNMGIYRLDNLLNYINMSDWNKNPLTYHLLHTNNTYSANLAYNSPKLSYAWGIEIEHQMNFGFLPIDWMKGIVVSYNLSITRSETNIISNKTVIDSVYNPAQGRNPPYYTLLPKHEYVLETHQSEGQPQVYGNVALGYDIAGFSARVSTFFQDKYVRQYSSDGTQDIIVDKFSKIDMSLKQVVTENISFFLNINNLTNRKEGTTQVSNSMGWYLPSTAELYGRAFDLGVRVSL